MTPSFAMAREVLDLIGDFPDREITEQVACTPEEAELFYPVSEYDEQTITAARRICGRCPVRAACAAFALRTGEDEGIWGGLLPSERRALRQSQPDTGEFISDEGVQAA